MKNICHERPAFLQTWNEDIDCALRLMVLFGSCAYFTVFRQLNSIKEANFQKAFAKGLK